VKGGERRIATQFVECSSQEQALDGSKLEMLTRLQLELDAMRGRGETARLLALKSETRKDSLTQHAELIEQAAASLEAIIRDIQKAWNITASSDGRAA
jgi:hypothetical protein